MVTSTRHLVIGYWHDGDEGATPFPHPQSLVDPAWEPTRRADIVRYLKHGRTYALARGLSYCRLGCKETRLQSTPVEGVKATVDRYGRYKIETEMSNGSAELCDDGWCWPEGLAHYVEVHQIRLPDEFVAHAASRRFEPVLCDDRNDNKFERDDAFWRDWALRHAPFRFEPACLACRTPKACPQNTDDPQCRGYFAAATELATGQRRALEQPHLPTNSEISWRTVRRRLIVRRLALASALVLRRRGDDDTELEIEPTVRILRVAAQNRTRSRS